MSKPSKFEFKAGEGGAADGISAGMGKVALNNKKKRQDEEDDEDDDEDEDDDDEDFVPDVKMTKGMIAKVLSLKKDQSMMDEMMEGYKAERIELEMKYSALKEKYYETRTKVVSGEIVPDIAELSPEAAEIPVEEGEEVTGIPQFWLNCLNNCGAVSGLIQEEDVPALSCLSDIKCSYDDKYTEFTLSFFFTENDYFSNTVLTKKYGVSPDLLDEVSPALTLNESSEILWKAGKNLCVTEIKKKQKAKGGKNKGQVRTITKEVPKHSFFNYFSKPKGADGEEEEDEEEEDYDEEKGPIRMHMEEDYDVGHQIRTGVIPQAILYFTGEAEDDDDDEDEDDEDEDEDEDGDEDEDEDDEEEEEVKPKGKGKGKGSSASAASKSVITGGQEEKPECKQN